MGRVLMLCGELRKEGYQDQIRVDGKRQRQRNSQHKFASHLAMKGIDLYRIGKMMGHTSVVTTQIYAHLLPSSLNEAITEIPSITTTEPDVLQNGDSKPTNLPDFDSSPVN